MLTERNKQCFKKLLSQRLNESLEKAQDTLIDIRDLKDKLSNHVDEASHASAMGFALRIRDRETKLIRKIREALGSWNSPERISAAEAFKNSILPTTHTMKDRFSI